MTDDRKGSMTVSEAGRKGGKSTSERHGPEFYREINKKRGQKGGELINEGKRLRGES